MEETREITTELRVSAHYTLYKKKKKKFNIQNRRMAWQDKHQIT